MLCFLVREEEEEEEVEEEELGGLPAPEPLGLRASKGRAAEIISGYELV